MHKWRRFEYSFVCIEISATSLVLELNFQKKNVTQNEASRANLNVDKRIFELPPFMHRVYIISNAKLGEPSLSSHLIDSLHVSRKY